MDARRQRLATPGETFVDAGAWIAASDHRDQYHLIAIEQYEQLLRQPAGLVTTNLVVAEVYNALLRTLGHRLAMRFLASLRESPRLVMVYPDQSLAEEAEAILSHYVDQDFSYDDAVSFAVMRQRRLTEAFGFDHHFLTAGFGLVGHPR